MSIDKKEITINRMYKDIHDPEEVLQVQFDEIFNQKTREEEKDKAEINYDSILAKAIKQSPIATGAKDAAKCNDEVIKFRTAYLEKQREVDAGKRILDWLENSHQWEKMKYKKLNNIGG